MTCARILRKPYGDAVAVDGVTFGVRAGETVRIAPAEEPARDNPREAWCSVDALRPGPLAGPGGGARGGGRPVVRDGLRGSC